MRRGKNFTIDGIGGDSEAATVEGNFQPEDSNGTDDDDFIKENELSTELSQQISFMRIQATLSAHRLFELTDDEAFDDVLNLIHKDVPRTDRETDFYGKTQEGDNNLVRLRDILMTFAAYNQNISYVQGMNDLLARFQR